MPSRSTILAVTAVVVLVGAFAAADLGYVFDDTERRTVSVADGEEGTTLARVHVRVADTFAERRTGLSETESLGPSEGMLFVHEREGNHTYWMRGMSFPLDIVFVDANGTITEIHHAQVPPEGASPTEVAQYRGRGKYVLEVPHHYTDRQGIKVGDRVLVDESTDD